MERAEIASVLGDLLPYYGGRGHFQHVVNTQLGLAEAARNLGHQNVFNDRMQELRKYVQVLTSNPELLARETAFPIPAICNQEESVRSNPDYIHHLSQIAS